MSRHFFAKENILEIAESIQKTDERVLLWENPNPNTTFAAQTVNIDNLTDYPYIDIEMKAYRDTTRSPSVSRISTAIGSGGIWISSFAEAASSWKGYRRITGITSTGITFGNGGYSYFDSVSANLNLNDYGVPTKIWGIKLGASAGGSGGGGTLNYPDLLHKPTINGVTLVEGLSSDDLHIGDTSHEEMSQADFDALTPEEQNDGTVYFITDGIPTNIFVDDNTPVGMIAPYGGTTDPEYWLICDGRAVSRTAYSELFSVIGTTYGTGDGSTTFNIPDFTGNVAVGASSTLDLGDTGGESTHVLVAGELPKLTGTLPHQAYGEGAVSGVFSVVDSGANVDQASNASSPTNRHYELHIGNDEPHNNMQPYVVTNYIIKAKTALSENQSQLDFFYPVGSYYETSDPTFNPNAKWGGTWEKILSNSDGDYLIDKQTRSVTVASGMHTITFPITTPTGYYVESCTVIRTPNPNWVYGSLTSMTNTSVDFVYNNTYSGSITGDLMMEIIFKNSCEKYRWHRVA